MHTEQSEMHMPVYRCPPAPGLTFTGGSASQNFDDCDLKGLRGGRHQENCGVRGTALRRRRVNEETLQQDREGRWPDLIIMEDGDQRACTAATGNSRAPLC